LTIDTVYRQYFAFDGKILINADFMKPRYSEDAPDRFMSEVSSACQSFISNFLYPLFSRKYVADYGCKQGFSTYKYSFRIIETYSCGKVSSYVYYSLLKSRDIVLSNEAKTVTFDGGMILPEWLLSKKGRGCDIVLGADGKPAGVNISDGNVVIARI
jgi:hypothetical protein